MSISPPLRRLCVGEEAVEVGLGCIREVLLQLPEHFNGILIRLCEPDGRVRGPVLVLFNGEDVRFLGRASDPSKLG